MTFVVVIQPNNKKKELLLLLLQRSSDKHGTHQGPVEEGETQKIPKRLSENWNGPHSFAHGRGRHFKLVRHVSYSRIRMLLNKFAIAMVSIVKHLNLQWRHTPMTFNLSHVGNSSSENCLRNQDNEFNTTTRTNLSRSYVHMALQLVYRSDLQFLTSTCHSLLKAHLFKDSVGRYRRNADINFPVRRVGWGASVDLLLDLCVCVFQFGLAVTADRGRTGVVTPVYAGCVMCIYIYMYGTRDSQETCYVIRKDGWMDSRERERSWPVGIEKKSIGFPLLFAPTLFLFFPFRLLLWSFPSSSSSFPCPVPSTIHEMRCPTNTSTRASFCLSCA